MNDLIERLRGIAATMDNERDPANYYPEWAEDVECAAAELDRLRRELAEAQNKIAELRKALAEEMSDEINVKLAEALEWIERAGCPNSCMTWEPDTIDSDMVINSGICSCGRDALVKGKP